MKKKDKTRWLWGTSEIERKAVLKRFGDLRLLGISLGLLFLCVIGSLLIRSTGSPEPVPSSPAGISATPVIQPDAMQDTMQREYGAGTDPFMDQPAEFDHQQSESLMPGQRSREERERIYREMREQMPEGVTLTG